MTKQIHPHLVTNNRNVADLLLAGYEVNCAHRLYSYEGFVERLTNYLRLYHPQLVHRLEVVPAKDGPARVGSSPSYEAVSRARLTPLTNKSVLHQLRRR